MPYGNAMLTEGCLTTQELTANSSLRPLAMLGILSFIQS